jgi:hypothetical protein
MIHHGSGADCVAESSIAKTVIIRSGQSQKALLSYGAGQFHSHS